MKSNDGPFRILTAPYDLICTNLGCDSRKGLARGAKAHAAALTFLRIAFLLVCAAIVGAGLSIRVHAQSLIGERTARLEAQALTMDGRITRLESNETHDETAIATMGGEFEGAGVVLGLLQVVQMMLGVMKRKEQ